MENSIAVSTGVQIAVASDPAFLEHHAGGPGDDGNGHPERPERLRAAQAALAESPWAASQLLVRPRDATTEELTRVHTPGYVEALHRIAGRHGHLDADTYFSPGSLVAALRAAGGALSMVDALVDGAAPFGLALVRPPGHHARPGAAMGFCLLNNVAVAAAHARSRGAARVAIVDWDVHHGNGTQEMFYEDPSVLYVSLHQFPFYPGTGSAEESGGGEGTGTTVNVPLSAGADGAVYQAAFDRIVCPALAEFDPDLVLISAGFDAHERDPLASMRLTSATYGALTRSLMRTLPRGAAGRLALVLEGGYDLEGLRGSLLATLEALHDASPGPGSERQEPLSPRHSAELSRAEAVARRHFHLD
jgi:acetoin utilization deacetylase AcuC-like enzyme